MKQLLKKLEEEFKSKLNNTSIACCFLLSINQNEPQFAYDLALSIDRWNPTLVNNLKVISLSKLNRLDEAEFYLNSILTMKRDNMKNEFEGKVFKLTVSSFREAFGSLEQSKKQKYELVCQKAEKNLFDQDLFGYCTIINHKPNTKNKNQKN